MAKILKKIRDKNRAERLTKTVKNKKERGVKKPLHRAQSVQKRSTVGIEVEFFICDKNGRMVNEADALLKQIKKKGGRVDITKEAGKNMIEVGCYPDLQGINALQSLAESLETLIYTADEGDFLICPLGTYPGSFNPVIRQTGHYKIEEKLFGRNAYKQAARCCGTHIHYALPWGVFDSKKLRLKRRIVSKHKQSLVNVYNFLTAADPGLTTFAQSSPFFQGGFVGKDARALAWRGDQDLKFEPSLYNSFPMFGELKNYQHTGTDLMSLTEHMYDEWMKILRENGAHKKDLPNYKSVLEANWTPLRVSYHSTMEDRGMDINTPLVVLALSQVIQNILRAIQERFVQVEVSDKAINEPFRYEKKKILIPPFTYVKTELQHLAFYKGLEDEKVYHYCKRLLWLAKKLGDKKDEDVFEPLERMLENKKTVSDDIITQAKKLGYKDFTKQLPNEIAAEIALSYSNKLFKEMVLFRELAKRQNGS